MPSLSSFTSFFLSTPAPTASESVITHKTINPIFNPESKPNQILLTNTTATLMNKLAELQDLDKGIMIGLAVGITTFTLSSLLPFGVTMAIASFGYSAYCIGKREQLAMEYRAALSDAVECLKWTLLNVTENKQGEDVLDSNEVRALFDALSPLMSEEQIRDAIDDNVEDIFVEQAGNRVLDLFGRNLNKEEKALVYGIYGYERGGVVDLAKGLWYLACKVAHQIAQSVKSLFGHEEASTSQDLDANENQVELKPTL